MDLHIRVEKKHLYLFVGLVVLFSGIALALATAPNPGHSWSEIECNSVMCVNDTSGYVNVGGLDTSAFPFSVSVAGRIKLSMAPMGGGILEIASNRPNANGLNANDLYLEAYDSTGANPATQYWISGPDGTNAPKIVLAGDNIILTGNVGIGTPGNPQATIDAYSTHYLDEYLTAANTFSRTWYSLGTPGAAGASWNVGIRGDYSVPNGFSIESGGTSKLFITQSGNVGIGTTNPQATVDISGSDSRATAIRLTDTTTGGRTWELGSFGSISNYGPGAFGISDMTGGGATPLGIAYGTNGYSVIVGAKVIQQGVSYGTFYVSGPNKGVTVVSDYLGSPEIGMVDAADTTKSFWLRQSGGTELQGLYEVRDASGGVTSSNVIFYFDTSGTLHSISDRRLKTNIQNLTGVLDKINNINAVTFNWKDKNMSQDRQIGMIAQEVESQFPELVSTDSSGYKSLDYSKFTAVLLEAIKEQQKEIDELKAQINSSR